MNFRRIKKRKISILFFYQQVNFGASESDCLRAFVGEFGDYMQIFALGFFADNSFA